MAVGMCVCVKSDEGLNFSTVDDVDPRRDGEW